MELWLEISLIIAFLALDLILLGDGIRENLVSSRDSRKT
ncbi:MAG: hypothetical protein MjAS7_1570 [Metallosphaera javensis (ex Sakai et al. 2022)]|nr:MAG: hypothetical protein MjAS7_1570 [Metallosphaera javensis (ex Sakai et al. 2022)]